MIRAPLVVRPRSDLAAGLGVIGCALFLGVGIAHSPKLAASFVLASLAAAVVLLAPPRFLAAALVAGSVVVPAALFEAQLTGTSLGATPLAGQARLLLCLAAVAVARMLIPGSEIRIPRLGLLIIGAFVIGLMLEVATAAVHGTYYSGLVSDLYRQLTYPLAFFVGVVAGFEATRAGKRTQLYEAIAVVVILAAAGSVAYWGWATGRAPGLPLLANLFGHVRASSSYPAGRSIFPFVQDSPNLGAIAFALLAAGTAPPLLLNGTRRSRTLAVVMVSAVGAAVLSTQSRTGLIALLVAPIPFLLLLQSPRQRRRAFMAVAILAVLVFQGYQFFPQGRSFSLSAGTLVAREGIWSQALGKFYADPLLGQGYHYSARANFVEARTNFGAPDTRLQSAQSEYLGQLVDGGVVAGLIFIGIVGCFLVIGLRLVRLGDRLRGEGIAFFAFVAALLVAMTGSSALQSAVLATFTWLFLGLVLTAGGEDATMGGLLPAETR